MATIPSSRLVLIICSCSRITNASLNAVALLSAAMVVVYAPHLNNVIISIHVEVIALLLILVYKVLYNNQNNHQNPTYDIINSCSFQRTIKVNHERNSKKEINPRYDVTK